ncbi:MAG TPA: MFS transporter [Saprospiraceae bacterium]|nr:MFS transporter [Saprospiraceae bacterium]
MKVTTAWTFYDWANSAFSLVITSAIFPSYFLNVTVPVLHIGNITMSNSSFYAYIIATAYLFVAIMSPFASGFADSANNKKMMMLLFTIIGSFNCFLLFFFDGMSNLQFGATAFIFALIGFIGSIVFYNAFLPEITTEDRFDSLSARGFSMGYIGSVILLLVNLALITYPDTFGLSSSGQAARVSFAMVGIWWIGFATIPLHYLPGSFRLQLKRSKIAEGLYILKDVWYKLRHLPAIKHYLTAFFFYNAGVQTVMLLAATFAKKELNFSTSDLIIIILILQLVAVVGAIFFSKLSGWRSNKFSLMTMLLIWVAICVTGYLVVTKTQFYILAATVGLVMGGIQSLSRSTYSKLIYTHQGETTSFFSFYDVVDKISTLLGTFTFGFIENVTDNMRNSIFALGLFFICGIALLAITNLSDTNKNSMSEAL